MIFDLKKSSVLLLFAYSLAANAWAESATTKAQETLRNAPVPTADAAGTVPANAKVEIVERKGFWAKVKSGELAGWVKLSVLTTDQPTSTTSGISALASGRIGSGNIVSASGTRGLSSEDLRGAKPDMQGLAKVRSFAVKPDIAEEYGRSGGLGSRKIEYLSAPAEPANSTGTPGS